MVVPDPSSSSPVFACGLSALPDPFAAAEHVCEQAGAALGRGPADLAMLFFSSPHVPFAESIAATVRRRFDARCLIGCSAESVLAGQVELERVPGVSLLVGRLPGVEFTTFTHEQVPALNDPDDAASMVADVIGAGPDLRATFLLVDPFSVPLVKLVPAMSTAVQRAAPPAVPGDEDTSFPVLVGGLASAAKAPGANRMILNDTVVNSGAVGVSLRGPVRVDAIVSQGCRPFGPTFLITKARGNIIFELGGRPALEAVHEAVGELTDADRHKLGAGLFVGRVIDEYKPRFGRSDFLIRNVMGVDKNRGAIAVGDLVRVGQTVRLHLRDAATADEDLALLMDAQKLRDRPAGSLLITCNGRGARLFGRPHHDASAVARAFGTVESGQERAKAGRTITAPALDVPPPLPLAGFFGAGEIGPVGHESHLHGHTACVAMFRAPGAATASP